MVFKVDKQTLNDLDLFGKNKNDRSILSLFDYTKSIGGRNRLHHMFENPLTDKNEISNRIEIISQFKNYKVPINIEKGELDFIEHYLAQNGFPVKYSRIISFSRGIKYKLKQTNEEFIVRRGIKYLLDYLSMIHAYAFDQSDDNIPQILQDRKEHIKSIYISSGLLKLLKYENRQRLSSQTIGKLDYSFRQKESHLIRQILDFIYFTDVYQSIARAIAQHGFCMPRISDADNYYKAELLFHPLINYPVKNNIEYVDQQTVCFLTGPNMAGKSTFLKSLGISVYLAHLGFPVPAKRLETSIFNGLLTTINLSDNIQAGYSHFYSEVLRVRYVAEQINEYGKYFVIFDELFR